MMKKLVFLFISLAVGISCEQKDCCVFPEIELQGKFVHEIPDCDNDSDPEINCTEWLMFVNGSEVDLVYGGGDIVYRFDYRRKADELYLEGHPTSSYRVFFAIVDAETLVRTDTNDTWKKVD